MFRGCPVSGRMSHQFDKVTNRCKFCGRWRAGFAPKKEPVRPRAECQICERRQATNAGVLWHHGYTRPGIGFIVGDCPGVNHKPYPATSALVGYLEQLRAHLTLTRARLVKLPTLPALKYTFTVRDGTAGGRKTLTRDIPRGADAEYDAEAGCRIPAFDTVEYCARRELADAVRHAENETARVVKRIEAAAALVAV